MRYYVEYEVEGFNEGVQKAGPYPSTEIDSQAADIAGFEGVKNVRVIPANEDAN